MKWKCGLLSVLLTVVTSGAALGQTRIITGTVTEEGTSQPIASAQVTIRGSAVVAFTRSDGTYTIGVPEGAQELLIRIIGFQAILRDGCRQRRQPRRSAGT